MAASFSAELHVSNSVFKVLTCRYHLNQPTDPKGRPLAGVRSVQVRITLTGNNYQALTSWAVDPFKALNGYIRFINSTGGTLKVLAFEQCYCVSYQESFVPQDGVDSAYKFDLGLTAAKLYLDATLHDNQWLDWKRSS